MSKAVTCFLRKRGAFGMQKPQKSESSTVPLNFMALVTLVKEPQEGGVACC